MKAWLFSSTTGGLEKNLILGTFPDPKPTTLSRDEIIVKVLAVGLNPADYKVPEMGFLTRTLGSPVIPGVDFAGKVHATHAVNDSLPIGTLVFGKLPPFGRVGTCCEYTVAKLGGLAEVPQGLNVEEMAGLGTAGSTAWQALKPYVKPGSKVFINGGSGGTGTYMIQIAKALGAHVSVSCSEKNVALVKELGADEVVDYTAVKIVDWLASKGQVFDHVVDNVGDDALYNAADYYMNPRAKYIQVGGAVGAKELLQVASKTFLPTFMGGGKRAYEFLRNSANSPETFRGLAQMYKEGKITSVIEKTFDFEDLREAIIHLKKGRTRGKLVLRGPKE